MITFSFECATVNEVSGWIAVRRIDGVYDGKLFGTTKKAAQAAFDER